MGNTSEKANNPDYFMDSGNIVVVTVGYRVGPFGFLCLGDEYVPGNQGLWDQQMALRWVHQNIQYFGGDKNLLTLGGNDAGSVSTSYHIVSPQSAGLFTNAICMSGNFTSPMYSFDKDPEEVGKQFDVTRERIRQIEAKALRKLRHPTRSSHLRGFLDD